MVGELACPAPHDAGSESGWRRQTASLEDFEDMTADRAALAGYTVYFAYDSAAVRKSEKANLQAVADALSADSSAKLLIEGQLRRARHGGIQPVARRTPRAGVARGAGQTRR